MLENYCHIGNQHPQICLFAVFCEKTRMPKLSTKNACFQYLWAEIWKQCCHIWNQQPRICLIAKFCGKAESSKVGWKNALLGYFLQKMPYLVAFDLKCFIWVFLV